MICFGKNFLQYERRDDTDESRAGFHLTGILGN
jgi:hypothetical protein